MYNMLNILNFIQLSALYLPLNLGRAPNFDTSKTYILKLKMYEIDKIRLDDMLYCCKTYEYSGVALLTTNF